MRIKEVDDVEHESLQEQWEAGGRGIARRQRESNPRQSSEQEKNRTRDDASCALQLVQTLHQGKGVRGGLSRDKLQNSMSDNMFTGEEKERKRLSFVLDESCAQQEGSEEVDRRLDMSKADGMAS